MNIDKTQIRILAASVNARYSDAQRAVACLEAIFIDVKMKLEGARNTRDTAKKSYDEIMEIIALIEDAKDV